MFTHEEVWAGIDRLAKEKGWSPSKLAREAGLDPTTFNRSKRHTNKAKPRWPSTESLAKILDATRTPFDQFVVLMTGRPVARTSCCSDRLRCIAINELAEPDAFDEAGRPNGGHWDEIDFPAFAGKLVYAIEVRGDDMAPIYRDGDILVVSPDADVRRHDRIVLKTAGDAVEFGTLLRRSAQRIDLERFAGDRAPLSLAVRDVRWLCRILWASQ